MLQPKPHIPEVPSETHGGIYYAVTGNRNVGTEDIIDFSTNCNPFGPPPGTRKTIYSAVIDRYPDSESLILRQALSDKLRVPQDQIIIGSGSTELIRLIATAYFGPGDNVFMIQPTYGEYEIASRLTGAEVVKQKISEKQNFRQEALETINAIKKIKPSGVFICNPNNPTGNYLEMKDIVKILEEARESLIILDEAYIAFTDNTWNSMELLNYENLIILRSMTKDYALPGLRIGYAISSSKIISVLNRIKPPWNISSTAQAAGLFVLQQDEYVVNCNIKIRKAKNYLIKELTRIGFQSLPSQTNFFLVKVNNAAEIKKTLLKRKILVRDCTSFGLPDYIRISARSFWDCIKLVSALQEIRLNYVKGDQYDQKID